MTSAQIAALAAQKLHDATDAERFRLGLGLLVDAPYGWGAENLRDVDCSGSVAWGILTAGYNVRLTAELYLRLLFTERPAAGYDPGDIAAIFWTAISARRHGDRTAQAGEVVHVTPVIGDDAVLDASWGKRATIRSVAQAEKIHRAYGTQPELAAVDWQKLDALHRSGRYPVNDEMLRERP